MSSVLNISKEIKINSGDLNLYIDIDKIGGDGSVERIVDNEPAHSLVANFARALYTSLTSANCPDGLYYNRSNVLSGAGMLGWFTSSFNSISSITPGNPTRVVFSSNIGDWDNTGNEGVQLMGHWWNYPRYQWILELYRCYIYCSKYCGS